LIVALIAAANHAPAYVVARSDDLGCTRKVGFLRGGGAHSTSRSVLAARFEALLATIACSQ
jgi:hypothetical protein